MEIPESSFSSIPIQTRIGNGGVVQKRIGLISPFEIALKHETANVARGTTQLLEDTIQHNQLFCRLFPRVAMGTVDDAPFRKLLLF